MFLTEDDVEVDGIELRSDVQLGPADPEVLDEYRALIDSGGEEISPARAGVNGNYPPAQILEEREAFGEVSLADDPEACWQRVFAGDLLTEDDLADGAAEASVWAWGGVDLVTDVYPMQQGIRAFETEDQAAAFLSEVESMAAECDTVHYSPADWVTWEEGSQIGLEPSADVDWVQVTVETVGGNAAIVSDTSELVYFQHGNLVSLTTVATQRVPDGAVLDPGSVDAANEVLDSAAQQVVDFDPEAVEDSAEEPETDEEDGT